METDYIWGWKVDKVCSYRTYEEWKLLDDTRSSTWNLSSYRTYEEWKHAIVKCVEWSARVLTVPMRNGNWSERNLSSKSLFSSYRTYEEWKLEELHHRTECTDSSYRTYEEWKRRTPLFTIHIRLVLTVPMRNGNSLYSGNLKRSTHSSYRTYEEWKQVANSTMVIRWPPSSYRTYEEWKQESRISY